MSNLRTKHVSGFKAKVALEAVKETKTISALASEFEIHPTQVKNWKTQLETQASKIFINPNQKDDQDKDKLIQNLYNQIGKLTVQRDFLKKKLGIADE